MIIEHDLSLDIANYNNSPLVKIKQYDQNSHQLNISLKNNDVPFSIEAETTAKLRMTKPDGYTVYKNCSIADNIISVVLDGSISTAYGKAPAEIGLYKKEELLLSSTFCINIIKSAIDEGGIISSDDFGALTKIIEKSEATISACEEATQNADNATQLANDTAEEIKQKADSGDFNGFTPQIGENGNWYINNIDTGKPSVGKIPEIIPINQGGTGNNIGYIQTGKLSSTTAGEKATIEGVDNKAFGKYSHAEGKKNFAKGNYSHAEGSNMNYDETELSNRKITSDIIPGLSETITISGTSAYGMSSHAEGAQTLAFGDCSHAEGTWCVSGDKNTHSEGYNSQAVGDCSHAEGADTKASGAKSHAEGEFTRAEGAQSHSEGYRSIAKGDSSHAEGAYSNASGVYSHAEGRKTTANGSHSHAEGGNIDVNGAELEDRIIDRGLIDIPNPITISGSTAYGLASHAEGSQTLAYGAFSHSEGIKTIALGNYSHAEGGDTKAHAEKSHAEGSYTNAKGYCSHAEGTESMAAGEQSHAEGVNAQAYGDCSHAEGAHTQAYGDSSHVEGARTQANGYCSHAEGYYTIARENYSHVEGKYNIEDSNNKYVHIIGNGTQEKARSNAHTVDWNGNAWYQGNLYLGGTSQDDTEAYIANVPEYGQEDTDVILMVKNGTLTWVSKNEFISEIMSKMNN